MALIILPEPQSCRLMTQEQLLYWQHRLTDMLSLQAEKADHIQDLDPDFVARLKKTTSALRITLMAVLQEMQRRESLLEPAYAYQSDCRP